jgi:serine/threonine-protein kinase
VVARFEREARLLRTLEHPGIVRMIDHGSAEGVPWFAMELVEGRDLKSRLANGPLSVAEVAAIFPPLLEALDHAHGHGVVHRDIKPANVLLAGDAAKLADFGIALPAFHGEAAMTRLTETAAVIGTLPYMSPEQRAGGPVDRRSDLFSIGVVLYEAVTGRLPVGAFPPASRVNRSFTAALDRVVDRLLQPEPEARFLTAALAARALRPALRDGHGARRLLAAGAAAALAATLGLGIPALSRLLGAREAAATGAQPLAPLPATVTEPPAQALPPIVPPVEQAPPPPQNAEVRAIKSRTIKLTKTSKKAKPMPPDEVFKGTKE